MTGTLQGHEDIEVLRRELKDLGLANDVDIMAVQQESTLLAQKLASENADNGFKRPTNVVEFGEIMQTTKAETYTSESCLRELSCLPLGGYSVMSTFPAVNVSTPVTKPVVMAMASMDAATFFRDVAPGADSPMSGLIAGCYLSYTDGCFMSRIWTKTSSCQICYQKCIVEVTTLE